MYRRMTINECMHARDPPDLFENALVELVKVVHLVVSLAIVLIIRYNPKVLETYDADLDTLPRAALLLPPFLLALVFNRVRACMGKGIGAFSR